MGWTVKEAEVAARERIMWRFLSIQAAKAAMHNVSMFNATFNLITRVGLP